MTRPGEIDVAEELENTPLKGARGAIADDMATRRRTPGFRLFMGLVIAIAVLAGGLLTWKAWQRAAAGRDPPKKPAMIENTLPPLEPHALPPADPVMPDTMMPVETIPAMLAVPPDPIPATDSAPPVVVNNGSSQPSPEELLRQRRFGGGFTGNGASMADSGPATPATPAAATGATSDSPLESQLKPLQIKPSRAGQLGNRDYLLTRGAMIDCGQQSKLVTDQPGMVVCYTTANIYSANGRVALIDAGSKITGHYQTGIRQGQARVFVAWQRIETPQGVIIDLDSPGTDPLGAAGEPGQVDSHFWQRFGGAILLSILGDAGEAAIGYAQRSNSNSNTNIIGLGNTRNTTTEMATEALRNSINIPPTLYKNQGARVNIFVARDLDFSNVYSLQ